MIRRQSILPDVSICIFDSDCPGQADEAAFRYWIGKCTGDKGEAVR